MRNLEKKLNKNGRREVRSGEDSDLDDMNMGSNGRWTAGSDEGGENLAKKLNNNGRREIGEDADLEDGL